jgi:hypothetical protein
MMENAMVEECLWMTLSGPGKLLGLRKGWMVCLTLIHCWGGLAGGAEDAGSIEIETSFDTNPTDKLQRRVTNAESRRSEPFSMKFTMSYEVYEGLGSEG